MQGERIYESKDRHSSCYVWMGFRSIRICIQLVVDCSVCNTPFASLQSECLSSLCLGNLSSIRCGRTWAVCLSYLSSLSCGLSLILLGVARIRAVYGCCQIFFQRFSALTRLSMFMLFIAEHKSWLGVETVFGHTYLKPEHFMLQCFQEPLLAF
jgi:hypothetical protein